MFYCILLFATFVAVLWELSGVIHVDIGGTVIPIPGFMVFVALTYSAIGTSLALWAGFPLVGASNLRQTVEANFRFGLARAREYSESIALIGGDNDERTHLQDLLRGVRRGWERQTYGLVRIIVFTTAYGVLANPFPLLVAAPRYIMGLISLGTLMQMAQAFSQVTAALAFPARQSFRHRAVAGLGRTRDGAAGRPGRATGETRRQPNRANARGRFAAARRCAYAARCDAGDEGYHGRVAPASMC